jgi:hypothetical protein
MSRNEVFHVTLTVTKRDGETQAVTIEVDAGRFFGEEDIQYRADNWDRLEDAFNFLARAWRASRRTSVVRRIVTLGLSLTRDHQILEIKQRIPPETPESAYRWHYEDMTNQLMDRVNNG